VTIERLGLRAGEPVRFRRADRARWQDGIAVGLERDGSLSIRDANGASRAVPLDAVLVRVAGRRGGRHWEPLLDRAARTEQLDLFGPAGPDGRGNEGDGRGGHATGAARRIGRNAGGRDGVSGAAASGGDRQAGPPRAPRSGGGSR